MTSDLPVLAGLDDVAWGSLEHAYGPADDVPFMLRALASGDDEQTEEALYDLHSNIWHQGSVYPATVPAVPFLVRIATSGAAGGRTAEVLQLLGRIASSNDAREMEDPDAVRSAVAALSDAVVTLLDDSEAETRSAALFVLVHAMTAARAKPLIKQRWQAETEAIPRAEAMHAMIRVDAEAAADLADEVLSAPPATDSPDEAVLRVSSALAWVHAGRTVDARVRDAAMTPVPAASQLWNWGEDGELFDLFVGELARRQGSQASIELLTTALEQAREEPAEQGARFLATARGLISAYRSAHVPLAGPISRLLDRPELTRRVVYLLELLEPVSAARDTLVALAQVTAEADSEDDILADEALACLARWRDPVVPGLLARALTDRSRTLNAVTGIRPGSVTVPFDADLLAAIRRRVNEICDTEQEASTESGNPFFSAQSNGELGQYAKILTAWRADANPAAPELIRLLEIKPVPAAQALAAISARSTESIAALRAIAESVDLDDAVQARIAAAQAIRTLTQDSGPLLAAVLFGLTTPSKSSDVHATAAEAASGLPDHADLLVPHLLRALEAMPFPTPSLPAHQARMEVGRALWRLTGRPDHAIDILRGTLALAGEQFTSWTVATAADFAAELGPEARPLIPALEAALPDPSSCPAAARALLAVDPEGSLSATRREELVEPLINSLTTGSLPSTRVLALDLVIHLAPLPADAAVKLRALADQDERFPVFVMDAESLRTDELLSRRIREWLVSLDELTARAAGIE